MRKILLPGMLFIGLLCAATASCAGGACSELADICQLCPADGNGPVARASCEAAVDEDDEEACEDRVDRKTYASFGCQ